jgi:DNA topoisomerase IB
VCGGCGIVQTQQLSVAVYLIDKLALRAGGEKDDDLADTVGCCTLRVGHVIHIPQTAAEPSSIKFDFLGKDSIRYEQTHEVDPKVYFSLLRMKKGACLFHSPCEQHLMVCDMKTCSFPYPYGLLPSIVQGRRTVRTCSTRSIHPL